jgi:PAS domain S-box-containing protein
MSSNRDLPPTDPSVLMAILENGSIGYWDLDIPSGNSYLSPAMKNMFGYEEHEMDNTLFATQKLLFPEDLIMVNECLKKHIDSHGLIPFSCEIRNYHKNGSTVWVVCKGQVIEWDADGNPIRLVGCNIGITEQKLAQEALKISEESYRSLVNNIQDGIFRCDLEGNLVFISPASARILGYSTVDEMIGMNLTRDIFVHPEDRERLFSLLNEKGKLADFKIELRRKDGSAITIVSNSQYYSGPDGKIIGIEGIYHDITERNRAEQSIKESEALLRSIFEASPAGISLVNDRKLTKVNTTFCSIIGYSEEELVGQPTQILYYNDEEFKRVGELYLALEEKSPGIIESRFRHKNGTELFVLIYLSPLNPNNIDDGVVGIVQDITSIRNAEIAAQKNQLMIRSIYDATPIGLGVADDETIVKVNKAFSTMVGYAEHELIGRNALFLYPDDKEFYRVGEELRSQLAASGKGMVETIHRRSDGTIIDIILCATLLDKSDLSSGMIFSILDVSERKRMEREKKHLEEMLLHSQKLESIGRLAGGIAHDFNNMITAILGNAEMVKELLPPGSKTYAKIETIERAAESAANLTKQLLAFSRKQIISPRIINLNTIVENIRKMLLTLIGENISLHLNTDSGLNTIMADPGQLEQIILNLTVNARDAMPSGGHLCIETRNVEFDEDYSRMHLNTVPGTYVMLAISDTGTGMSKDAIDHCFEPFFTTKGIGKGTGLGLATVYGNVRQIGGTIELYSELEHGTTFKLYFPAIQVPAKELESRTEPAVALSGTETILLAEDNEMVLNFSNEILTKAGYKVLVAATGEQALFIAQHHTSNIHLLITDIILPGINGRVTSDKLVELHPGLKTLYTSGYTAEVIGKQGIVEEGIDFISKPFATSQLLSKVRSILDRK